MSRYVLLPETLAAPTDNPDNHCFCRDHPATRNCTLAGVLDISSCQSSAAPAVFPVAKGDNLPPLTRGFCCRQTRLHLPAPLPPRQPRPAGERPGPEPQRGASHDLPGRGTGELGRQRPRF